MRDIIHYNSCPVCGGTAFSEKFRVKDHTVSGETFTVCYCNNCTACFTQDIPGADAIGPYYKSEDYISHTNTSKGIVNRLYKWVRKRTVKQKRKLIERETGVTEGTILDIGSGTGAFAAEMKAAGWQATGIEPDPGARKVAREQFDIFLSEMNLLKNLPAAAFDAITLWHVLEHVHDLHGYMDKIATLIKPGGRVFIAVPNYTSGDATEWGAEWAAWDVPRHLYHFSPQSMQQLAAGHQLKIISYKPMWYDSFYVSLLSSKYKSGKTALIRAFVSGLRSNFSAMKDVRKCSSVIYILGK